MKPTMFVSGQVWFAAAVLSYETTRMFTCAAIGLLFTVIAYTGHDR